MGVNSLPKTVTRQRRGCDLNPGPSAPESSMLTTRLPSHLGRQRWKHKNNVGVHIQSISSRQSSSSERDCCTVISTPIKCLSLQNVDSSSRQRRF